MGYFPNRFVRSAPSFLYVFLAVLETVAPRDTRSGETTRAPRATARTALSFWREPIRQEQPLSSRATERGTDTFPSGRPQPMPSGETAPLSASTGTCGGSCVRVHDQQARLARRSSEGCKMDRIHAALDRIAGKVKWNNRPGRASRRLHCRMSLGQSQASPGAEPGGRSPPVLIV